MQDKQLQEFRINRLKELSDKFGGNTALGKRLGYSSGAHIGNLVSGFRPITEKFIIKVESMLRLDGWFSNDGQSVEPTQIKDAINVPLLDVAASMGSGEGFVDDAVVGNLTLSPNWVSQNLASASNLLDLRFIHAYGDSMEPTFYSGDILLVDSCVKTIDIDGIYVLEASQRLFVKRVTQDVFGRYTISSDNPMVKTISLLDGSQEVNVLGRVLWAWSGKRL